MYRQQHVGFVEPAAMGSPRQAELGMATTRRLATPHGPRIAGSAAAMGALEFPGAGADTALHQSSYYTDAGTLRGTKWGTALACESATWEENCGDGSKDRDGEKPCPVKRGRQRVGSGGCACGDLSLAHQHAHLLPTPRLETSQSTRRPRVPLSIAGQASLPQHGDRRDTRGEHGSTRPPVAGSGNPC